MPKLIHLYIRHVAIGFSLSAAFVAALVGFDVAGLGHLIMASDAGLLALVMLFVFNGLVFASVQFAVAVMRMGSDNDGDFGPRPNLRLEPIAVSVRAQAARHFPGDRR